jgi:putative PIG3 family NAD(P)H quinone oxidoreductase
MHAVVISEPGGPEVLRWTEVPDPRPGPGEVLVEVAAAGVNRADLMQRQGLYPPPPGAPPYPGLEISGVIAALGHGVTGWRPGQQVCALLSGGGYAERVAVPAGQLLPVPPGSTLVEAAALPESACTVYSNVFLTARLAAGETLLVHGGGSGIGTMAIQLAKQAGARVAVTAGSRPKLDACLALGADIAINYREEDFVTSLMAATDGHGADVILDIVGAAYLARNIAALAQDGRIANIGMQQGRRAELDFGALMAKRAVISSTSLRARPAEQKASIVAAVVENVWPAVGAGLIRPVIDTELPLEEAAQAHRIMTESTHTGKIVLRRLSPGWTVLRMGAPAPHPPLAPVPPDARPMAKAAIVSGAQLTLGTR